MKETIINNLEDLESYCKDFSLTLKPGDVVCLTGDLGAGKTAFVQAISKAFNISNQVQSPTFNILLQYKNENVSVNHFDLYRLEEKAELEDIGFYDAIESNAISFVEWAEKFKSEMPEDAIWVTIENAGKTSRKIISSTF